MKLRDILGPKPGRVISVSTTATIHDAARAMVDAKVGSVLVLDDAGAIAGILTERDVLRATAEHRETVCGLGVAEIMTRDVLIGLPDDSVESAMALMTERRLRHVPVLEEGEVIGVVSIGDVVRTKREAVEAEVRYLKDYVTGRYPA
jgi:CBS domain-containing protein